MRRKNQRGITLVEIMIVVAIIGLVTAAVSVAAIPALRRAQCKTAVGEEVTIQNQIGLYRTDNGDCPKSLNDLYTAKYISKEPIDPWGKPYSYKCPGEKNPDTADVWSSGNDKQEGTADDVRGWVRLEEQCK